jgi:hypothetical protein
MTVTPGELAAANGVDGYVWEPAVDLSVKNGGTPVTPLHVTITFTGKNSAGATSCTDVWRNVLAVGSEQPSGTSGTTYGIYPAPFASNATKGTATASYTGDTGSIQVCADYGGYHATYGPVYTNGTNPPQVPLDVKTGGTSGNCP